MAAARQQLIELRLAAVFIKVASCTAIRNDIIVLRYRTKVLILKPYRECGREATNVFI
jgi:hypothetical protein